MLEIKQGGITAKWDKETVPLAHLGCKLNRTLLSGLGEQDRERIAAQLGQSLPGGWKSAADVQDRIADASADLLRQLERRGIVLRGVTLIDTMRNGSDYYRPGGLMTGVAERIRAQHYECGYDREDDLCPETELLDMFRKGEMRFSDFAQSYNDYVASQLDVAINVCVTSLARGRLPVFYCVDPYIPGFADRWQFLRSPNFSERHWLCDKEPQLEAAGCHRVVLIEAVARELLRRRHKTSVSALVPDERSAKTRTFGYWPWDAVPTPGTFGSNANSDDRNSDCPRTSRSPLLLERHELAHDCAVFSGWLPDDFGQLIAEDVFNEIWKLHPDERSTVRLFGKDTLIPRWQTAYERDYAFSGQVSKAIAAPDVLTSYLEFGRKLIDIRLNGMLVNWYDPEQGHYIGPHHDDHRQLAEGSPIVTISLGASQTFRLSCNGADAGESPFDLPVVAGSVVILPWRTNKIWKHEVPHCAADTGRRISITLRAFRDESTTAHSQRHDAADLGF